VRSRPPAAAALLLLAACALTRGGAAAEDAAPLVLVRTIPLPRVEGRLDHFAFDARDQRLFLAALGNGTVEVIDLAAGRVVHQLTGLAEPQGVAFVPDTRELVVANGGDGSVRFFATATWAPVAAVALAGDADNLRYDATRRMVHAGYGDGGIAAIDAASHALAATIPLPGHPEGFVLESGGPRIFVNVPGAHRVAVLDRATGAAAGAWDLEHEQPQAPAAAAGRAAANFPMAVDEAGRRLFIGCRRPACLLVLDLADGRRVARLEVSGDTDDVFFDAATRRLYLACGEGAIDVVEQLDADHYRRSATVPGAPGARTACWLPEARLLCLAIPHRGTQAAAVAVYRAAP
jgi:DNA-binding beta-propeller fold protein YncE